MSILGDSLAVDQSEPMASLVARAWIYGSALGRHDAAPMPQADYSPEELSSFLDGWAYAVKYRKHDRAMADYIADDLAALYASYPGDAAIPDEFSQAIPNDDWYDYEAMYADEMEDTRRIIDEEWEGKRLRMVRWHESEEIRAIGERAYAKGGA